jgi:agmatinase
LSTPERWKHSDPTMWSTLLHAGLASSFLRLPHLPPSTEELSSGGVGAAIYGLPWDSTVISRSGTNYGPRGIREASLQALTYNATLDVDLVELLNPVDCGDAEVIPGNAEKTFDNAQRDLGNILAAGAAPVVLGGDHSVTIPAVRAVAERHENPALVLIDAHLDTASDVAGETLNHCCPIARAVDAGFPPQNIAIVGATGWLNPRSELAYCREHGIEVIWLEDIWENGIESALQRTLEATGVGTDGTYLSVDIDALDGAYAPGTGVPGTGGLTSREMLTLVRGVASRGLVGMDLVEVAPTLDPTIVTSTAAVRIIMDALASHAGVKR